MNREERRALCAEIRQWRKQNNLTLHDMVEITELSYTQYSQLERCVVSMDSYGFNAIPLQENLYYAGMPDALLQQWAAVPACEHDTSHLELTSAGLGWHCADCGLLLRSARWIHFSRFLSGLWEVLWWFPTSFEEERDRDWAWMQAMDDLYSCAPWLRSLWPPKCHTCGRRWRKCGDDCIPF